MITMDQMLDIAEKLSTYRIAFGNDWGDVDGYKIFGTRSSLLS